MAFIFGQSTDTPDAATLARRRQMADQLRAQSVARTPRNVGEGIASIGQALAARMQDKRLAPMEEAERNRLSQMLSGLAGGGAPAMGGAPMPAGPNQDIADETMAAIGQPVRNTGGNRDEFIAQMMPHAIRVSQQTGLDPRLVIAQAAQETGWGKSAPGNNFFGIKSHGKGGGNTLATNEVINGQTVRINDSFRGYGGMGESADDYARFLQENPRYRPMLAAGDLDSQVAALGSSGYATDPNYARSVGSIARSINIDGMPTMSAQGGAQAPQMSGSQSAPMPQGGGMNPQMIQQLSEIASNPYASEGQKAVAAALMQQQMQAADPMRALELERAQLEIQQLRNPQRGYRQVTGAEIGMSGQDAERIFNVSPDGQVSAIGGGGTSVNLNTGTIPAGYEQFTNPETGAISMRPIPGGPADAERRAAQSATQMDTAKADQSIALIDSILNDPSLSSVTGGVQGRLPAGIPGVTGGQRGADLSVKIDQLKGQAFLEAFESLKGGGSITEREGEAATAAMGRLNTVQSEAAYREALQELRGIMERGKQRAAQGQVVGPITQGGTAPVTPGQPPQITSDDEYNALPSGTQFIAPDGTVRRKP